ncbi:MAG: tRNA delta(2)-isopentenylpyrophosphate transferase [Firmicutes bacterium]|nr:tRNA delta(2)-isopentenylpyrophosphate transferase [Bacillota bacterium]
MINTLIVVCGPTASGKTKLGIELCKALGGEVISADSMQIYRGMNVGTAKPSLDEREGIPHHMLDVADPWEPYSVARYVEEATACVEDILARGKRPVVVGGTGLYIDALIRGRQFADARPKSGHREVLQNQPPPACILGMKSGSSGRWRSFGRRGSPSPTITGRVAACRLGTRPRSLVLPSRTERS